MTGVRACALAVLLAGSTGLACAVSASASSQTGSPGAANSGPPGTQGPGKPAHSGGSAAVPGDSPGAPAAPACTAALNDLSTSLFGGRVLIRLPKGLELIEQNGFYALLAAPQQATSCGAPVKYAAVGFFVQPAANVTQVCDQLLQLRGLALDGVTFSEEGTRGRNYTAAYAASADPKTGAPPARGWIVLREAPNDKYAYFALYETDEASWDALRPVFQESGRHLLVKPRALQGPDVVAPAEPADPKKPKPKKPAAAGTIQSK
jgi:hypothetical protein